MNQMHNGTDPDQVNSVAMTIDPVITWLEQVRDFMGTTASSKEMAQRAIDRLRPPKVDPWTVIGPLLDDLGELRANDGGALVSDRPNHPSASADDGGYYGGYLVAESVTRRNAIAFAFVPRLLILARDLPEGRRLLEQLAEALQHTPTPTTAVRDRLDGTYRLARLATEFRFAGRALVESDPFYAVSTILEHLAAGFLGGAVDAAVADIQAWLEKREGRAGART